MKYSEKLVERYREEILSWDWEGIEKSMKQNAFIDEENNIILSTFIGTVLALTPSGKYYMPWTTNQTIRDEIRDSAWYEALESILTEKGFWHSAGEGDPCNLFIQAEIGLLKAVQMDDLIFITQDQHDQFLQLYFEETGEELEEST